MGEQADKACPKCGSPMGIRLGEFVCGGCGYFMALDAPDAKPGLRRSAKSAAPVFNAGRRGIALYGNSHAKADRLKLEKWIIIALSFLSMSFGNYLLNPAFMLESMPEYPFKSLFFAGVFSAGLMALALFIDWRGFKLLVLVLVCLTIIFNLWSLHTVSQLKTQLILYKLLADEMILVWLAILLFRDTARTR